MVEKMVETMVEKKRIKASSVMMNDAIEETIYWIKHCKNYWLAGKSFLQDVRKDKKLTLVCHIDYYQHVFVKIKSYDCLDNSFPIFLVKNENIEYALEQLRAIRRTLNVVNGYYL